MIIDERASCSTPSGTTTGRLPFATTDRDGMAEKQGVADLLDLIKNYARQETTEPLKGAGRWIGFGLLGSVLLMLGGIALTLPASLPQEEAVRG